MVPQRRDKAVRPLWVIAWATVLFLVWVLWFNWSLYEIEQGDPAMQAEIGLGARYVRVTEGQSDTKIEYHGFETVVTLQRDASVRVKHIHGMTVGVTKIDSSIGFWAIENFAWFHADSADVETDATSPEYRVDLPFASARLSSGPVQISLISDRSQQRGFLHVGVETGAAEIYGPHTTGGEGRPVPWSKKVRAGSCLSYTNVWKKNPTLSVGSRTQCGLGLCRVRRHDQL